MTIRRRSSWEAGKKRFGSKRLLLRFAHAQRLCNPAAFEEKEGIVLLCTVDYCVTAV